MTSALARWQAILCALTLLLCALLVRPFVEHGIDDDWAYIRMVQDLARTGHIVYNGWESPILGWILYLGALFVKIFGFSFTVVRMASFTVAMATAFLLQRTLVRAGLHERNATIATLAFVLSPIFLFLAVTFMTDVPGLFVLVLCLYACLRALQSSSDSAAARWICFAALANAVGGTVRQIAWLGALVMVPSALWLMRRRSRVLLSGALVVALSGGFIVFVMQWFASQPYTLAEAIEQKPGRSALFNIMYYLARSVLELGFFATPALLLFLGSTSLRDRKATTVLGVGGLFALLFALMQLRRSNLGLWLAPFLGDWVSPHGMQDGSPIAGARPVLLGFDIRLLLTIATIAGMLCFLSFLLSARWKTSLAPSTPAAISSRDLAILLAPFALAYIALLVPRATSEIYDRYLLAPLVVALLVLFRTYQDHVRSRVPAASLWVIGVFATFGVAAGHDAFSMFRARLAAINQLRAAGVPATAIDGGFEYDGWTQIEQAHFINDSRIKVPASAYVPPPMRGLPCEPFAYNIFPAVVPRYTLSFDPDACLGSGSFPPVAYRAWLGPHRVNIYTIKTAAQPNL